MAGELIVRASWSFTKGNQSLSRALSTFYQDISGTRPQMPTVTVGTAEEDLIVGDVGTPGLLWLRNLDAANFVTWGPKDSGSMISTGLLLPTTVPNAPVPPTILYLASAVAIRWIADTAACDVEVALFPA